MNKNRRNNNKRLGYSYKYLGYRSAPAGVYPRVDGVGGQVAVVGVVGAGVWEAGEQGVHPGVRLRRVVVEGGEGGVGGGEGGHAPPKAPATPTPRLQQHQGRVQPGRRALT